jgi:hypothetical protein
MLNHINPLTGLRYADDPALSFIEFQNEDNIFWSAIEKTLEQAPTYRAMLCRKFSIWLKAKYGTEEQLLKAWGNKGLPEGETMAAENIYPRPNHGLFSREYRQAVRENRPVSRHILDRADFLYQEQSKFYKKFEKAIRSTGYKGPLVGSCWQAGTGLAHLLNLHADAGVGIVDRHNYFGGGEGHRLKPGKFDNSAMVSNIGSGLYGTGLQQVADRPFAISEWMSLIPSEWTAESSPIIATYGMGLQGWDASYVYATDLTHYSSTIQSHHGIYNATSPTQMALYPSLARMIYRGDIKEGETIVNRKVDIDSVLNGKTPIKERIKQDFDRKAMESSFPLRVMAAGKILLTFADENKTAYKDDLSSFWKDSIMSSTTGQLQWSEKGNGYFSINSPGTKGIVGFTNNRRFNLGEVAIRTENKFAVVLVTSLEQSKTIRDSKKILVSTIARARNKGMGFNEDHTELLATGNAPLLLEPVRLELSIVRKQKPTITVLDHMGNRTGQTIKPKNRKWILDGAQTKAIYYLIEY